MTLRVAIVLLALAGGVARAQQKPPAPKVSGYRVSTEGGVEGTRTIRYDAEGRPIDGNPREAIPAPESRPAPLAPAVPAPAFSRPPAAAEAAPAAPSQGLRTADGRPLPFALSGSAGGKRVDGSVDADSALRDFGRPNDLLSRRFETDRVDLGMDERFSTSQVVTLGTWSTRFSGLGSRRADIALRDDLGAEVRAKDTVEVRSVERRASPWSRRTTDVPGWDERLEGAAELGSRQADEASLPANIARVMRSSPSPRTLDQLSMQDINRYQFRRARSDQPGLPVVRPGSGGEVRSTVGE